MGLTPILPSKYASVLELEDSPDLGSGAQAYGFESLQRHKCSISIAVIMRPCQGRDDGSIPLCCSKIGVYLLSLIRSRKSKWLHVGSNPITPTNAELVQRFSMPGFQPGDVSSILVFCTKFCPGDGTGIHT